MGFFKGLKGDRFNSKRMYNVIVIKNNHIIFLRMYLKMVKNGITELVFILDRSGSMAGLESDTIGGFNGMIERQWQYKGYANADNEEESSL